MALDLTGISNVGEFYSPHYLNAVLEGDLKATFARWKAAEANGEGRAPDKALSQLAGRYFKAAKAAEDCGKADAEGRLQATQDLHAYLMDALGYERKPAIEPVEDGALVPVLCAQSRDGKPFLWVVEAPFPAENDADGLQETPLAMQAPQLDGDAPALPDATWRELLDDTLFRSTNAPRWIIVLAGREVILADGNKWARGAHLRFALNELFERRQAPAFRAMAALLHRDTLNPEGGACLLDTLDENAHRHAFGVSTDLKRGATASIELLANEAVYYLRYVSKTVVFADEALAKKLTEESLIYLYRLLFLFYVEARGGALGVVPMGSDTYRKGYSLESLRDLELVALHTEAARNGHYIDASLKGLFALVDDGNVKRQLSMEKKGMLGAGFEIWGLRSPLFSHEKTPTLRPVRFRNFVLQEVLQNLSLSRPGTRKTRGRISYATLGINQLGAVYEGLLSYTGFFATEDLYEVRAATNVKDDDARTFFVGKEALADYADTEIVTDGGVRRVHPRGRFVFRLASRDREKSASYYTPEVLTQCLTKYTLQERLKTVASADEILTLTICEPAMGSGAFLNEAINQLAAAYLARKQAETGKTIKPDAYPALLQQVKRSLAVNNAYGVDLNPLATELGQLSLWLNVLHEGARAPYFGTHIRAGNSLIGARRETYGEAALSAKSKAARWFKTAPKATPLHPRVQGALPARPAGSVYHFLVADEAMAPYEKDKVVKGLEPEAIHQLKVWRKAITAPHTPMELHALRRISDLVDTLWAEVVREQRQCQAAIRQPIAVWGQPAPKGPWIVVEACEAAAAKLRRPEGPYARLKAAMDYWCALWCWPVQAAATLPTRAQWRVEVEGLLEGSIPVGAMDHPALVVARGVASRLTFFHWELEFGWVLAARGGFDLILGNPPWLKLQWNEPVLADFEPTIGVKGLSAKRAADLRGSVLSSAHRRSTYFEEFEGLTGAKAFLGPTNYPLLKGVQANLYKNFVNVGIRLGGQVGHFGLIHQKGLYDDPRGGALRGQLAQRLSWHLHFINKLMLFDSIEDQKHYELSIARSASTGAVQFNNVSNLFHPRTLDESLAHDGNGPVPGIKNEQGNWDLRGHASRVVTVDTEALELFARLYDPPGTPPEQARLPVVHSQEILQVLRRFAETPRVLADLGDDYYCTEHFHETNQQKDGTIKRETRHPEDASEWVVSGPHFYVGTPFNKTPNEGCRHNQDYTVLDHTTLPDDYLPRTNYVPACAPAEYRRRTPHWRGAPVTERYRLAWRRLVAPTGERTLVPAIVPPGVAHANTIVTALWDTDRAGVLAAALLSSVAYDFFAKSSGKADLYGNNVMAMGAPSVSASTEVRLIARALRLNCLTTHYADLWAELYTPDFNTDTFTKPDPRLTPWTHLTPQWHRHCAVRTPFERRQTLVELDALAALALGLTADELCTIYRVQFPVLQQYERDTWYDRRGHTVFTTNKGQSGVGLTRAQWTEIKAAQPGDPLPAYATAYQAPFDRCDREADMRQAYAAFSTRLGDAQ